MFLPNIMTFINRNLQCDGTDIFVHLQKTMKEQDLLSDQNDETLESVKNPRWNAYKAVLTLLLGTVVAAVFADPLVDAVDNFSTATSISSFFVSFVILPFASSSEIVSALIFASWKKIRTASLTYSEVCFSFHFVYIRVIQREFYKCNRENGKCTHSMHSCKNLRR